MALARNSDEAIALVLAATEKNPDYGHLNIMAGPVSVELSGAEKEAILAANDRGVELLLPERREELDRVIAKLKEVIWP